VRAGSGFALRYSSAFEHYLAAPGEERLSAAYEIGRLAVRDGRSVLDLAAAHHDALLAAVSNGSDASGAAAVRAGGAFFLEAMSAYEMVQRVLQEARETAGVERRQAVALRQLSSFLADASIALDTSGSLVEMLQLVAEHAREMLGAARCIAQLSIDGEEMEAEAEAEPPGPAAPADLAALYDALGAPDGPLRLSGAALARHPALTALEPEAAGSLPGWLAAPLTALDGRRTGLIQLFAQPGGEFTELDEAVLVQLAQMASAAVERAQLYRR